MGGSHLFPHPLPKIEIDIIILTVTTKIMKFILSKGVGRIWVKYKVQKIIQKNKITIWKWIKSKKTWKTYK